MCKEIMESSHEESVALPMGACSNSSNSCSSSKTTTTTTTTTLYALRQNPKRSHRLIETGITSNRDHHHRHHHRPTGAAGGGGGTTATSAELPLPRKPLAAACDGGSGVPQDPPPPPLAKACSECGKEFLSWKALFGHMRCHPERQWRGILPPRSHNTVAAPPHTAATAADVVATDSFGADALAPPGQLLIKKKRKKKKKKKRKKTAAAGAKLVMDDCFLSPHLLVDGNGDTDVDRNGGNFSDSQSIEKAYMGAGRSPGGYCSGISERRMYRRLRVPDQLPDATAAAAAAEDEDDHDMADCLVMLAFASSAAFHKEEDDDEEEEEEDQDANNNGGDGGGIRGGGCGGGRVKEEQRRDIKRLDCFPVAQPPKIIRKRAAPRRTQNLLWRKEEDGGGGGGGAPRGSEEYKCSACKRIFRSHQALGGHRASHKKVKGCFARTNSPTSTAGAVAAPEIKGLLTKLETANMELHLELHLATPASAPTPAATATIAADIGGQKPEKQQPPPLAPKFLDLNLPPPMDTHEEEDLLSLKTAGAFLALW